MFRRGTQGRITHAIIFDEAHRASKLRLLPTMAKECRKYGISLILASQEARDFDESLYSAVANYLALHVTENDARAIARHCVDSDLKNHTADRLKALPRYEALFFSEGKRRPIHTRLTT
jgi:DNA helicase HerA-like ATPase